jgi:hypothetical protein
LCIIFTEAFSFADRKLAKASVTATARNILDIRISPPEWK